MGNKKIFSENMYRMFWVLCAVVLTESVLLRLTGVVSPWITGLSSAFFMTVTAVIYFNKKNPLVYLCTAAVPIAILIVFSLRKIKFSEYAAQTAENFFDRSELSTGETILVCSVVSIVLSVLFFILSKLKAVRIGTAVGTAAVFIVYGLNNALLGHAEVFAGTGIIITLLIELSLTASYKKETSEKINSVISHLLPAVMICSLAVAVIPQSEKPISWSGVKKIAAALKRTTEDIASEINLIFSPGVYDFGISMQGYSATEGKFSGNIIPSNEQKLKVFVYATPRSSLYLIGTTKDAYKSSEWSSSKYPKFDFNDYYIDYCETVRAIEHSGYTSEEISEFTNRTHVSVRYDNLKTKSLFYPLKTYSISNVEKKHYNADSSSISFKKTKGKDTGYDVSFLEVDYNSDRFINIARNGLTGLNNPEVKAVDSSIPHTVDKAIEERREYIKQHYTTLPSNITERTYKLAEEITAGCDNNYDKLAAIEAYLNNNYSYTLTPGEVPDGYEPVDYFLFESKEGFCTYFASAMTVLARCESIPARYVQGFSVDYSNKISSLCYGVLGADAHAWTEAYIDGVGFVPFEPTASFGARRYGFSEKEQVSQNPIQSGGYNTAPETEEIPEEELEESSSDNGIYLLAAALSIIGVVLIISIYIALRMYLFVRKYKKSSDTDKFITCYKIISHVFAKKYLPRKNGETADEYAVKISELFVSDEVSFCDITKVFDKIRYGEGNSSETERETAEKYFKCVYEKMRQKFGPADTFFAVIGFCI